MSRSRILTSAVGEGRVLKLANASKGKASNAHSLLSLHSAFYPLQQRALYRNVSLVIGTPKFWRFCETLNGRPSLASLIHTLHLHEAKPRTRQTGTILMGPLEKSTVCELLGHLKLNTLRLVLNEFPASMIEAVNTSQLHTIEIHFSGMALDEAVQNAWQWSNRCDSLKTLRLGGRMWDTRQGKVVEQEKLGIPSNSMPEKKTPQIERFEPEPAPTCTASEEQNSNIVGKSQKTVCRGLRYLWKYIACLDAPKSA